MQIPKSNFDFLKQLKKNNNRDWFNSNKEWYLQEHRHIIGFADSLIRELGNYDEIETVSGKKSLFRIYRDVRFSKDKSPYKTNWSGRMKRATAFRRGGFYFSLEPGNSFVGGGFWGPNPSDLALIRSHIAQDDSPLKEIISHREFKKVFGELQGEKVKTAPRGYQKDHPSIDLLRYKQFLLLHHFTDSHVLRSGFVIKIGRVYQAMLPFFDYMSEILTTDLNGRSLLD